MKRSFFVFGLVILPLLLFSQKKKFLFFDENWQVVSLAELSTYSCDCYVDEREKFVGPFKCYHIASESLVKFYNFQNDVLHGLIKEYYLDGKEKLVAEYFLGEPVHEWKEYDQEGNLILHRTFDENSRLVKDYFQESNPYDDKMNFSAKAEEAPIYTSQCMLLKMEAQRYACSDEALFNYFSKPPLPPTYLNNPNFAGKTFVVKLKYKINKKGIVDESELLESSGDIFLDELALAHVLNMVPFEAAKEYGNPIAIWQEADIVFKF
ncbi:MAG: energy transducer TonB [Chitinophagales bacterium]|nr:energy transducer TonB [Chitinophagales bacterium]